MNRWAFLFIFLLIAPFVHSAEIFSQAQAESCLNQSTFYLTDLESKDFNVLRVNDTLEKAELIYLGQIEKQKRYSSDLDFSPVKEYCDEIEIVYDLAITSKDDYYVLRSFYELSYEQGMDNSTSLEIIDQVKQEIENERYERVSPLVEEGYQVISEMVRNFSTLNRFYQTATLGVVTFFETKWREVVITLWSVFILFLIFKKPVKKWRIKQKLKFLGVRKAALEEYFKKVQKDYFGSGGLSQRDYLVRGGNYSNFVLQIDREVAILNEELKKLEEGGNKPKKTKWKKKSWAFFGGKKNKRFSQKKGRVRKKRR